MAKLENFIEKYLKNKKATDYEGWLAMYGEDPNARYREELVQADNSYQKARAEHGTRAATLYRNGLSGSGYSDYLNHSAYAARAESLDRAKTRRAETEASNQKGYLGYLAKMEQEAETTTEEDAAEKERKVFSSLLSKRLTDENAAITFLTANGIDEERAKVLAQESLTILRGSKSYRDQIASKVTYMNMDYYNAYNYALMMGVSEETARIIASISSYDRQFAYSDHKYYN